MSDKTTALYCRLALADTERIAAQEETLRRYAEEKGYGDCAVYRDNGVSGSTLPTSAATTQKNSLLWTFIRNTAQTSP